MEYILLFISLSLNLALGYYSVKVARKLLIADTNTSMLKETFQSFLESLEAIHESEMYYGDQTLQELIQQSKDILVDLQEFQDIFSLDLQTEEVQLEEKEDEN
tara:strand:+ start:613 stop:921 length:309 start_codon:yes stop_codon:yes gene_type:complete